MEITLNTKTYEYGTKIVPMLLVIGFGIIIAVTLGYMAVTNDRGLILNGFIKFSEMGAGIFYGLLSLFGVAAVVIGVMGLLKGRNGDKQVILSDTSITAPKSAVSSKIIEIPYRDVTKLTVHKIQGQQHVMIKSKSDKLAIHASILESKAHFADLVEELQRRCG